MKAALERAIRIAGTQSELARRIGGKTKTGHIYHWLTNGVTPDAAAKISAAVNGEVTPEELCPHVDWIRDEAGQVTGYHVRVEKAA